MLNKFKFYSMVVGLLISGLSSSAFAFDQGDWIVRLGAVSVNPNDSSGQVGNIADSGVEVDDSQGVFINVAYMWRENIGLEVLAATPFHHNVTATGSIASLGRIAETDQLPPTFSIQYYFSPKSSFSPYLGAGLNYTTFFNEKAVGGVVTSISLDDSWGLAAQAGFDLKMSDRWSFHTDLRYINIETTATTNVGNVDVKINPWVLSVGVTTTF